MPGTRLGGDFFIAWPTISRGLMGAEGAASILYRKELESIQDETEKKEQRLIKIKEVEERLEALQREASQEIIDPRSTRPFLIKSLKLLANKKQELPPRRNDNIRL